jgi:hypothetical protein
MKRTALILGVVLSALSPLLPLAAADSPGAVEQIPDGIQGHHGNPPIRVDPGETLITKDSFKTPIEITIVAKTNSTNLRIGYTARQVIFNWEVSKSELRVDGGPGDGKHRPGQGEIPVDQYVTIKWKVTKSEETITVDGEQRFQNTGDYSEINSPISVFGGAGSKIKVMSLTTEQLD